MMFSNDRVIEIFSKHVPEELKAKKTGINIALIADFNIAGQITQLFRLINTKTIHRARCIILQGDYLIYDQDIVLSQNNPADLNDAQEIIKNADFFHIGRFPKPNKMNLALIDHLRPNNSLIQYFGSELRAHAKEIYNWHQRKKITGLAAWDFTMIENSPFFYHINMMFDASKIQACPKPEGTIKIVHPTTNRKIKKTELFLDAVDTLQRIHDVEPIVIEGKTNEECLKIKSQAHMAYDQISVGIYGVSAIESMAAGHVVFGAISNFAASVYPDNPIVWITPKNIVEKIEHYLINKEEMIKRSMAGKAWVKMHHNPYTILKQYLYLYDLIRNGHCYMESPDEQLIG